MLDVWLACGAVVTLAVGVIAFMFYDLHVFSKKMLADDTPAAPIIKGKPELVVDHENK